MSSWPHGKKIIFLDFSGFSTQIEGRKNTISIGLMGVGCNHTTTNPLKASNVAKPRPRKANISIKH